MAEVRFTCKHKDCTLSFTTQEELEDHYEEEHICLICARDYTVKDRKKKKCNSKCPGFCMRCMKDYLKKSDDNGQDGLKCVSCNTELSFDFVLGLDLGTTTFRNQAFTKLESSFMREQKQLIPQTQGYAQYLKDTEVYNKEVKPVFLKQISDLQEEIRNLRMVLYQSMPVESKSSGLFIFPCPEETCNGFVDGSGVCKLCSKEYCTECREEKKEGHVCDPGILESIKLIKINSKPCPYEDCGVYISKIDGCDQMWCAKCKRFWSWSKEEKLNIVSRHQIHNPEFLAYERRTEGGNVRTDVPHCDLVPDSPWSVIEILKKNKVLYFIFYKYYSVLFSQDLRWTTVNLRVDPEKIYKKIRADYLLKKIDEKTLEKKLLQAKLKITKDEKVSLILEEYMRSKNLLVKNLIEISDKNCQEVIRKMAVPDRPELRPAPYIYVSDRHKFRTPKKEDPPICLQEVNTILDLFKEIFKLDEMFQSEIDKITFSMGYKSSFSIKNHYYNRYTREGFDMYDPSAAVNLCDYLMVLSIDYYKVNS